MSGGAPAVEFDGLSVAYRDAPVLRNVSFRVPTGVVMGVVGPNGAGKSTLLKASLGLVPALTGSVRFFGEPFAPVRGLVGYMPQSASVDWDFPATVGDVVLMGTYGRGGHRPDRAARAAAARALERVDMAEFSRRQIGELSGGQRQRVFLARVLAQGPDLFLMDEPFAGIDAASGQRIVSVLEELRDQGRTVVLVHHDLATLDRICDWVTLLNVEVVASGPVSEALEPDNLHVTYGGAGLDWAVAR